MNTLALLTSVRAGLDALDDMADSFVDIVDPGQNFDRLGSPSDFMHQDFRSMGGFKGRFTGIHVFPMAMRCFLAFLGLSAQLPLTLLGLRDLQEPTGVWFWVFIAIMVFRVIYKRFSFAMGRTGIHCKRYLGPEPEVIIKTETIYGPEVKKERVYVPAPAPPPRIVQRKVEIPVEKIVEVEKVKEINVPVEKIVESQARREAIKISKEQLAKAEDRVATLEAYTTTLRNSLSQRELLVRKHKITDFSPDQHMKFITPRATKASSSNMAPEADVEKTDKKSKDQEDDKKKNSPGRFRKMFWRS